MQRNKTIQYDDDDLYDSADDDYDEPQQEYTQEDKDNFATLTPVVHAELEEAGLSASRTEIEDALWHYYWDVSKSVSYLKNARTSQKGSGGGPGGNPAKKEKAKSKFDEAAEKSAQKAGESPISLAILPCLLATLSPCNEHQRRREWRE